MKEKQVHTIKKKSTKNQKEPIHPDTLNLIKNLFAVNKELDQKIEWLLQFIEKYHQSGGLRFGRELLEHLNISVSVSDKDRECIPSQGKVLCIVNNVTGGLEALCALKVLREIRPDAMVISDVPLVRLNNFMNIAHDKMVPEGSVAKKIMAALQAEKAVICFPSDEPYTGLEKGKWDKSLIRMIRTLRAPVLPLYFHGKRKKKSFSFKDKEQKNLISLVELPAYKGSELKLTIGQLIPAETFKHLKSKTGIEMLRQHFVSVAKGTPAVFRTEKSVIKPIERRLLRSEIADALPLGETEDGKRIYLCDYHSAPHIVEEISRLRELTFRRIGEGTGKKSDIDRFDYHYKHLFLWDDAALEIVGAYRLGLGDKIKQMGGLKELYSATLFSYDSQIQDLFPQAIECGRSFIQEKYWNSYALEYLWHGIGAFLARYPHYKYLFGPVSISQSYPREAIDILVYFYLKYYSTTNFKVIPANPYMVNEEKSAFYKELFGEADAITSFRIMKQYLKQFGLTVPTLYKQYTELCSPGGANFLAFGFDPDFNNCTDGLIWVEIDKVTEKKRERYILSKKSVAEALL